jgi:hypothetical protein
MLMKWRMGALLEEKVLSGPGRKALCANPKARYANTGPLASRITIPIFQTKSRVIHLVLELLYLCDLVSLIQFGITHCLQT